MSSVQCSVYIHPVQCAVQLDAGRMLLGAHIEVGPQHTHNVDLLGEAGKFEAQAWVKHDEESPGA